ncbi:hypothetical protein [Actinotalea sp. Marseille-Q4924]|uniref:hypothetical protein n=1 Tax=Actinotalea sp. Marseille-Q4924 TaxID=2866571 RepID=UPI001CE43FDE|nr:hypothetical protein [Actinotalea sp. Marseille-Q4924]
MATDPSAKTNAWALFDRIVAEAAPDGVHTSPWIAGADGAPSYVPDYATLTRLLGVPLYLGATSRTGVPALALDVWLSYELRRAGFDPDAAWPRPTQPRILPMPISKLLKSLPRKDRDTLAQRLAHRSAIPGVTSASASILGKNYLKQVDVIMTDWHSGPELLISTKRMDSSYGKNAPNRIEESYGDAKNLRLRHPLAALGFVFGLRSDILEKEPDTAAWLIDLLGKLGREDDAYHATCLVMIEYPDTLAIAEGGDDALDPADDAAVAAGLAPAPSEEADGDPVSDSAVEASLAAEVAITQLPSVTLRHDQVPQHLAPSRFLALMVTRILDATPVNFHTQARRRLKEAQ